MCSTQLSDPLWMLLPHGSSASLCFGLPKGLRDRRSLTSRSSCPDLLAQHNREWRILIGAKWDTSKYFGSEVSSIFSINFYTKTNNFCQVFIDLLSVKLLFQISNGGGRKGQKKRTETVIYSLPPPNFFSPKYSFLVLSAVAMSRGISSFLKAAVRTKWRNAVTCRSGSDGVPSVTFELTFHLHGERDSGLRDAHCLQISDESHARFLGSVLEPVKKNWPYSPPCWGEERCSTSSPVVPLQFLATGVL